MESTVTLKSEEAFELEPVKCPRCGMIHLLFRGEMVYCQGQTDNPYASNGVCCLWVGRAT